MGVHYSESCAKMLSSKFKASISQKYGNRVRKQTSISSSNSYKVDGVINKIEKAEKSERSKSYVITHCRQFAFLTPELDEVKDLIIEKEKYEKTALADSDSRANRDCLSTSAVSYELRDFASDRDSVYGGDIISKASAGHEVGFILTKKTKSEVAYLLTSPQHMWDHFFNGISTKAASDSTQQSMKEKQDEFPRSVNAGEQRFAPVLNLPLRLILTPLKQHRQEANTATNLMESEFGPLHASLHVGNIVLEWNKTSLVIPHLSDYENQVDMQCHSNWVESTRCHHPKTAEELDFPEQIELEYMVTSEMTPLINVIITYNSYYYYDIFYRNCQDFVCSALKVLRVEQPTGFSGNFLKYFKTLREGRTPSVPERFETHRDLDDYVLQIQRGNPTTSMPQHDLEFILTLYLRFHLLSKSDENKEEWICEEPNCCISDIELLIKVESLLIHKFR